GNSQTLWPVTKCKVRINEGKGGAKSESMRREAESLMKASQPSGRPSWSRASRRHRVIQAKLRSTTHLQGSGRKLEGNSFSHSTSGLLAARAVRVRALQTPYHGHGPAQVLASAIRSKCRASRLSPQSSSMLGK